MAMPEVFYSVTEFHGINENAGNGSGKTGEAEFMDNFEVTSDGKLRKRTGYAPFSTQKLEGSVLQVIKFGASGNYNYDFFVLTTKNIYGYKPRTNSFDLIYQRNKTGKGNLFEKDGYLYLIGEEYVRFNKVIQLQEVTPYVPTVNIAKSPDGLIFTPFEKPNRLTNEVKEEFYGNGTKVFKLKYLRVSDVTAEIRGKEGSVNLSFNSSSGTVTLNEALSEGETLIVKYKTGELSSNASAITSCNRAMIYGKGNEVFLWFEGVNKRYYSQGGNATYFPVDNSDTVGNGSIKDMVCYYDDMLVLTTDGIYASNAYISESGDLSFPVKLLNGVRGAVESNAVVSGNTPVFIENGKIKKIVSTAIQDERNVVCISERITNLLKSDSFSRAFYLESKNEVWFTGKEKTVIWNSLTDSFYLFSSVKPEYVWEYNNKVCFFDASGYCYAFNEDGYDTDINGNKHKIKAYFYLSGIDFGTCFIKKQLVDLFIKLGNSETAGGKVAVIGDAGGKGEEITLKSGFFDFSRLSFQALVFGGNYSNVCRSPLNKERFYEAAVLFRSEELGEKLTVKQITLSASNLTTLKRE